MFEGGSRSITLVYLKGNVCESDNMQFCDKVYLDLKPECPRIETNFRFLENIRFFFEEDEILNEIKKANRFFACRFHPLFHIKK